MAESYEERRKRVVDEFREKLSKIDNDVWYIKTETGHIEHIAIDDVTHCNEARSRLISQWSRNHIPGSSICYPCMNIVTFQYLKDNDNDNLYYHNMSPSNYGIAWRCTAMVKKKGKGKKLKRCSNCSGGPDESFCSQHNKCFMKYINKYISVSQDVSKLIYKLL